jgi:hypothetical protein
MRPGAGRRLYGIGGTDQREQPFEIGAPQATGETIVGKAGIKFDADSVISRKFVNDLRQRSIPKNQRPLRQASRSSSGRERVGGASPA